MYKSYATGTVGFDSGLDFNLYLHSTLLFNIYKHFELCISDTGSRSWREKQLGWERNSWG